MSDAKKARARPVRDQRQHRLNRYILLILAFWTAAIAFSLSWNLYQLNQTTEELARIQARSAFQKDVLYRRWNAMHGGVYAPVSGETIPNPYLEVTERDIQAPSGRQLTLINPAYMTRQVHKLGIEEGGIQGHITSLNPIRPENAPDPWETTALQAFERGETETSAIADIQGVSYMRLMRPLITEESCMRCHEAQGYRVGDVRGGISISVPMALPRASAQRNATSLKLAHSALWLVGLSGIALAAKRMDQRIQERKQIEDALHELNTTLETQVAARTTRIRAEQQKSEAILRSVGDAIAVSNLEQHIQYVNDAFVTLTGYAAQQAAGQALSFLIDPGRSDLEWLSLKRSMSKGEIWKGELTLRRQDGRTYAASVTAAPMHDETGRLVGYVSSHRDNSQLKDLERARRQFITSVSHELRTPVTNIKLYTHLLEIGQLPEKTDQYLKILTQQAERLEHLTQDILELMILDSGHVGISWESVSLPTIISDMELRFQSQAATAGLSLQARAAPPDLPAAKGDKSLLFQALSMLVENAIIFTPAGGRVTLEATVREEDDLRWVTIAVQDTGPGILPEEKDKLFDRFYRGRLAESGHIPGTGLGLSMAQEIMKVHGGRITVESEPGQGSTFILWLRSVAPTEL